MVKTEEKVIAIAKYINKILNEKSNKKEDNVQLFVDEINDNLQIIKAKKYDFSSLKSVKKLAPKSVDLQELILNMQNEFIEHKSDTNPEIVYATPEIINKKIKELQNSLESLKIYSKENGIITEEDNTSTEKNDEMIIDDIDDISEVFEIIEKAENSEKNNLSDMNLEELNSELEKLNEELVRLQELNKEYRDKIELKKQKKEE